MTLVDPNIYLTEIPQFQRKFDRMKVLCKSALKHLEFFLDQSASHVQRTLLQKGIGTLFLGHVKLLKNDTATTKTQLSLDCRDDAGTVVTSNAISSGAECGATFAMDKEGGLKEAGVCGRPLADQHALYYPGKLPALLCAKHLL